VTFAHALPLWLAEPVAHPAARPAELTLLAVIDLLVPVACVAVAALIVVRRPRDPYALFSSLEILLFGWLRAGTLGVVPLGDDWSLPTRVARNFAELAVLVQFCVFPSGRFVPRWTAVLCALFAVFMVAALVDPAVDPFIAGGLWRLLLSSFFVPAVGALTYRFVRRAGVIERLQMKWPALGAGLVVAASALQSVLGILGADHVLATGADGVLGLASVAFALMFGFAILRYRLYDVDVLINRALVYGGTTAGIAGAFFAGIVVLQALLRSFTSGSELAVAASTLASFALFQPLRQRVQASVDRRFYRSHYDAQRTLDAFSVRLRDEVDLVALPGDLLAAVGDTMQPVHASLWLRGAR
jgi:hypothetical protein